MNRKLLLAAMSALLVLGACTDYPTTPQPEARPFRNEQGDTTRAEGGGSMGNGN